MPCRGQMTVNILDERHTKFHVFFMCKINQHINLNNLSISKKSQQEFINHFIQFQKCKLINSFNKLAHYTLKQIFFSYIHLAKLFPFEIKLTV